MGHVAGVVAVGGRIEVVPVASAAGVRERLTQSGSVVEVPALNLLIAVADSHLQVASLGSSRHRRHTRCADRHREQCSRLIGHSQQ